MQHHKINYVEFGARDLDATKVFFETVFNWRFQDYGPDYCAFSDALEETLAQVEVNGGVIIQAIFDFPGGRRFHFTEPSGNELAVWSDPLSKEA